MKHVLSLGAGVQSSTMALMAAHGEITPMPDCAIFADTQDEPRRVYGWLDWLEQQLPFPVIRGTIGKLSEIATRVRTSKKSGQTYLKPMIPVFTERPLKLGRMQRQCTNTAKIEVIRREAKKFAGKGVPITMWIGISTDEIMRMKDSNDKRIENRHPLIDMGVSREDCIRWWKNRGLPPHFSEPPRSACIYCPYHSDAEWSRIKTETPEEFTKAVAFENKLQESFAQCPRLDGVPFLHSSRTPLDQIVFSSNDKRDTFANECEGMCGV